MGMDVQHMNVPLSSSLSSFSASSATSGTMNTSNTVTGPKKIIRNTALKRTKEMVSLNNKVKLERVLGLTISGNSCVDCDPQTSTVVYSAGCVVVLYNIRKNQQNHILNVSKKPITACKFSWDGKFLVTGECGHQPHLRVWDAATNEQVASFPGHKFGINCVSFSPNNKYVVSVGTQHDMIVNVWDWKNNLKIASNKVSSKVKALSFSSSGSYFVTVGNRHVKFWYLDYSRSSRSKYESLPLMGRSAILGDQRNNYFCDVGCGRGDMSDSTYAITKSGLLCEFNSRRLLDKWVELRTTSANCLSISEDIICIGCAQGIVRCFDPHTLHFICTLPRPHTLGIDIAKGLSRSDINASSSAAKYADAIAIALDDVNKTVTCAYSDRSIYFWTISNVKKVGKLHSFLYHSGCIWAVETYPTLNNSAKQLLPPGTFLTCSSDDTIRIWNFDSKNHDSAYVYKRNIFSSELLKILYMDPELSYICDVDVNPSGGNDKLDTTYDGKNGVRSLRVSPNGQHLASGDRSGNIRVFDLEHQQDLCKIEAHDSEVLCLEYSDENFYGGKSLLASASRDRLIHIFNVNQQYSFVQTLDDHSSSITAVKFVCTQPQHNLQMISCGADKSLIFRKANDVSQNINFVREHHVVGKTTLYDMEVDNEQSHVMTACQDRMVRIYDVATGKNTSSFKGSQSDDGTLIKVALDPSGTFVATSSTDKSLYLYDYQTGECLATSSGHSELITGLKFSQNGRHLISVSGDGCIFIWKLPVEMVNAISTKLGLPLMPIIEQNNVAIAKPIQKSIIDDDLESITSNSTSLSHRFNLRSLPLWAKKQMQEEMSRETKDSDLEQSTKLPQHLQPKGRWAQRMESGQSLVVKSYLNNDSVIPYPSVKSQPSESDHPSDELKSFNTNGDGRNRYTTDSSSASGSLRHDDEDTDSSDMMVYYNPNDINNSTFQINEPENMAKRRFRGALNRFSGSGLMPSMSVPNFNELNSDDEDSVITTGDSDKSHRNSLYMSTENLDRYDQREKYLKHKFEDLNNEHEEKGSDNMVLNNSDTLTPNRQSISAKYHSQTPPVKPPVKSESKLIEVKNNDALNNSVGSSSVKPPLSKRRIELTKAIAEARKKLETLGWKGTGLSNSKSVANLRDIRDTADANGQFMSGFNSSEAIRRSISLSDLSFSPQRKLLPSTPVQTNISAPLWDNHKSGDSSHSEMSKSTSIGNLSKSELNKPPTVQLRNKGLWDNVPQSGMTLKVHSSGRMSAPPSQHEKNKSYLNPERDSSDDEESSLSSDDPNLIRVRPGTPPKPNILRQIRRSSTSHVISGKIDTKSPLPLSRTRRLWSNDLRSTKSEFNLSSIGRDTPVKLRSNSSSSGSTLWLNNAHAESLFEREKIDLSMTNPSTIPLTSELCHLVINELNSVAKYAATIYQRASGTEYSSLRDILIDGVSGTYKNLSIITQQSSPFQRNIPNDPNNSLPSDVHAMTLLQQYSDRLLNIVEQRMQNKNSITKE